MKILFFLSDNSVSGGSLARPRLTERKYNARESDEGGQYKVPRESTRGHPSVSAPILYTLEQGGLQVVSDHLSAALSSLTSFAAPADSNSHILIPHLPTLIFNNNRVIRSPL